ncbi:MAG: EI24 domain-containing protein [Cyclobacteriaceae bacterium]
MNFFNDVLKAFKAYWKAVRYIEKKRKLHLIFLPAIISILISIIIVYFSVAVSYRIYEFVELNILNTVIRQQIDDIIKVVLRLFFQGMVLFILMKVYRYAMWLLLAPFFLIVADYIYMDHSKVRVSRSIWAYFAMTPVALYLIFRSFFLELLVSAILLLLVIILSWVAPLAPFLLLLIDSFFAGIVLVWFHLGPRGGGFRSLNLFVKNHPGLILGNGLVLNIILLVPLLGVLFAPFFAMVAAGIPLNKEPDLQQIYKSL